MTIQRTRIIDLPTITDPRGSLSIAEESKNVPFSIKRIFYIYSVPENTERGGHAHKKNEQLHICLSGKVTYCLDDGISKEDIVLSDRTRALYTGPFVWHTMKDFAPNTVLLVINSKGYDPDEYIKNYNDFITALKHDNTL